ncbi:MAG: PP2C family serine/threonine-protein phosphatase [Gemmataceae bacterium]
MIPWEKSLPVVQSYGLTDRGRVRASNQDQFLIAELARTMWVHAASMPLPETQYGDHHGHVLLVADGMGGHLGGDVASALTVQCLERFLLHALHRFSNLRDFEMESVALEFQDALHTARDLIVEASAEDPALAGMGTTVTMALASGWKALVFHAGDSRCYLLRGDRLEQLTEDHTVVAELIRRGALRPENAVRHAYRHVVTNAVGGNSPQLHVDVRQVDLEEDDTLLLCSDGLTDMLSDERLAAILQAEAAPRAACERLLAEANAAGGRDNITAIVARVRARESRPVAG